MTNLEVVVGVLTVPPGVWVRPTGVREGLKDIERLPDTNAAAGITNFWTGGRGESSWRGNTQKRQINTQNKCVPGPRAHTNVQR